MSYIEISRDTLQSIANGVLELSASGSHAHAFAELLLELIKSDADIPAARGLLIFAAESSLIPTSFANYNFKSSQCVIDLLAFYEYLPKFDATKIPNCVWDRKYLQKMTLQMLAEHAKKSLTVSKMVSYIATLEVLRAFFAKKIQSNWIDYMRDPVLVNFIKFINQNCLHVEKLDEKSEINIRLGLLLFVLMHINDANDDLVIQCASFLKIKNYSEVTKQNQIDLLTKLREFIDNKACVLTGITANDLYYLRSEIVDYLSNLDGNHNKQYEDVGGFIDPRDNFASFGEFAYQGVQAVTSLASNLSGFFSLQKETPGTIFGDIKLHGLKLSKQQDPAFFKRWVDALLRLPDSALSEQYKRVIRKIMLVEQEEKLEDDPVTVNECDIPQFLQLRQA